MADATATRKEQRRRPGPGGHAAKNEGEHRDAFHAAQRAAAQNGAPSPAPGKVTPDEMLAALDDAGKAELLKKLLAGDRTGQLVALSQAPTDGRVRPGDLTYWMCTETHVGYVLDFKGKVQWVTPPNSRGMRPVALQRMWIAGTVYPFLTAEQLPRRELRVQEQDGDGNLLWDPDPLSPPAQNNAVPRWKKTFDQRTGKFAYETKNGGVFGFKQVEMSPAVVEAFLTGLFQTRIQNPVVAVDGPGNYTRAVSAEPFKISDEGISSAQEQSLAQLQRSWFGGE